MIVHVGQVVEDDRLGRVEEAPLALSEGRLERLAVLPEQVGGAVQLTQRQRLGPFQAEQLEGRRGACEPGVGRVFGRGMDHAGDDQRRGDGGVAGGHTLRPQGVLQAQLIQGVQREALAADGADPRVLQGVEVHGDGLLGRGVEAPQAQRLGDAFGFAEQSGIGLQQAGLARAQRLHQQHQLRPTLRGHGEAGSQVEQRALADLRAGADRLHESERGVAAAVVAGAGCGLADEHNPSMAQRRGAAQHVSAYFRILWHYTASGQPGRPGFIGLLRRKPLKSAEASTKVTKSG